MYVLYCTTSTYEYVPYRGNGRAARVSLRQDTFRKLLTIGLDCPVYDIIEYLLYASSERRISSSLWNTCNVSLERDSVPDQQTSFLGTDTTNPFLRCLSLSLQIKNTAFLSVNEATEGYCDITSAFVSQGEINRNFLREEFVQVPEAQYVFGERLRFVYKPDLKSVTVVQQDIYLPSAFWGIMVTEQINSTKYTMDICETLETLCPIYWERDGFTSQGECVARMSALPITTVNERGLVTMDANSTGCRSIHTNLARESPDMHCPHISYSPQEDINGNIKCSESNNLSPRDFFTEGDLALFTRAAGSFGLNSSTQFRSSATDNGFGTADDRGECLDSLGLDQNALVGSQTLPDTYFCAQYLESHKATGEHDTQYWLALTAMFVVVRLLGLYMLGRKSA
jgi:hypothetical protein